MKRFFLTLAGIAAATVSAAAVGANFCFGWNVQGCDTVANPSISLMQVGPIDVTCENCYMEAKGSLEFEIHPVEKTLKLGLENLVLDFVGEIDASASGQWSFEKKETPTVFQATLIDTHIGILPVHIWMEVPILVDLQGQFVGNADGKIGVSVTGLIGSWEAEYDHGWKHVYPNPTFEVSHTLDQSIQANGDLSLKIQPQILIHVDDIFDGGLTVNQAASVEVSIHEGVQGIPENADLECTLCEWVVGEAKQLIASNYTLEKAETFLDNLCSNLGQKLSPLCTSLVQEFLPQILELVESKFTPQQICQKLSLCPSDTQTSSDCCLDGNCCHGLEYCCNECDGQCVCSVHGKCDSGINTHFGMHDQLESVVTVKQTKAIDSCDVLEKRFETIRENFRRDHRLAGERFELILRRLHSKALEENCVDLLNHLKDFVRELRAERRFRKFAGLRALKASPLECTVCTFVVQEAEQLLLNNYTLTQIEGVLSEGCSRLGALSQACEAVVQQYLPAILEFLESQVQPGAVCQKLGLCASVTSLEGPAFQACARVSENFDLDWAGELKLDWFQYDKTFDIKLVEYAKVFPFGNCGSQVFEKSLSGYTLIDDLIQKINSDESSSWKASHNQFSTMTTEEIKQRLMKKIFHGGASEQESSTEGPIPDNFDARQKWGSCIHPVRDQMQCGSCWAFSASEVASDRLCIAHQTDVILSPEYILECDHVDQGCQGGELNTVWDFLTKTGTVSDSCQPYTSGTGSVGQCPKTCIDSSAITLYKAKSSKPVGKKDMQMEIMTNGPIQGAFSVYQDFMHYSSGVYAHKSGSLLGGHAIEIVGWGETSEGVAYWICKNSWNTSWGQQGYFWIQRGVNECGIEANAYTGYF